jgi:hypothetical protein
MTFAPHFSALSFAASAKACRMLRSPNSHIGLSPIAVSKNSLTLQPGTAYSFFVQFAQTHTATLTTMA